VQGFFSLKCGFDRFDFCQGFCHFAQPLRSGFMRPTVVFEIGLLDQGFQVLLLGGKQHLAFDESGEGEVVFHVESIGEKVKRARDFILFRHLFQDGGKGGVFVAIVFFGIVAFFFCPLSSTVEFFHLGFDGVAHFDPLKNGERLGFSGGEIDFVFHVERIHDSTVFASVACVFFSFF